MFPKLFSIYVITPKFITQKFSTSSTLLRNHYDSLGITPKATQSDIKTAYYKLSMMYHPDKNKSSEDASKKFRDITAAYEVLGNFKLRKLYDKGILHTADAQYAHTVEEEHPEAKFYQSREVRHSAPTMTGRTPIYNFDEWSKQHYGATFERTARARQRHRTKVHTIEQNRLDVRSEMIIGGFMTVIFALLMASYCTRKDYDDISNTELGHTK